MTVGDLGTRLVNYSLWKGGLIINMFLKYGPWPFSFVSAITKTILSPWAFPLGKNLDLKFKKFFVSDGTVEKPQDTTRLTNANQ